jgi:hypothetical protein
MLLYAYLPELTENEQQLNKFTPRFTAIFRINSGVFGWLLVVPLHLLFSDKSTLDDEIGTARWHNPSPLASIHSIIDSLGYCSSHVHALAVCLLGNQSG